jgi:hypothetical protein
MLVDSTSFGCKAEYEASDSFIWWSPQRGAHRDDKRTRNSKPAETGAATKTKVVFSSNSLESVRSCLPLAEPHGADSPTATLRVYSSGRSRHATGINGRRRGALNPTGFSSEISRTL